MIIKLNGNPAEIPDNLSVSELLQKYGLKGKPLVVELNGQIVHSSQHSGVGLKPGDVLEVVRMVGGG
jgi:sulfur carrier protein